MPYLRTGRSVRWARCSLIATPATVGSRGCDSLPFSQGGTAAQALALKASGVDFFVGYLGVINAARVGYVLDSGMAFMPVTLAGEYSDGAADELAELKALGLPAGVTVWLDLEGLTAYHTDPAALIAKLNAWADAVDGAGYVAGLYVGVPQPLTSDELYALHVKRYWHGQGSVRDRNGALSEPTKAGWCMTQVYPSVVRAGVLVDCNIIGQDFQGRVPTWVTK